MMIWPVRKDGKEYLDRKKEMKWYGNLQSWSSNTCDGSDDSDVGGVVNSGGGDGGDGGGVNKREERRDGIGSVSG